MNFLRVLCVLLSISRTEGGRVANLRGRKNKNVSFSSKNYRELTSSRRKYYYDNETGVVGSDSMTSETGYHQKSGSKDYDTNPKSSDSKKSPTKYCKIDKHVLKEKSLKKDTKKSQKLGSSKSSGYSSGRDSVSEYGSKSGSSSRDSKVGRYIINADGSKTLNPNYGSKSKGGYGSRGRCNGNRLLDLRDDTFSTPKDTDLVVTQDQILVNDINNGGGTLTIDNFSDPSNGVLIKDPEGGNSFTYRPNPGFEGVDSIEYEVSDGVNDGTNFATINFVVGEMDNIAPEANDDVFVATSGVSLIVPIDDILGNDVDLNNDVLEVTTYDSPQGGSLVVNDDGGFTYTPRPDFVGLDTFTYVVSDGKGGASIGTIFIDVYQGNFPPVANDDSFNVRAGSVAFRITLTDVLGNDEDPEDRDLTISSYTSPSMGILSRVPNGGFVYLPQGFEGQTSFTYTIVDSEGESDTATVTLNVVEEITNSDPELTDDSYAAVAGEEFFVDAPGILENDKDPDGDTLSISDFTNAANGKVTVNEDGSFLYRAVENFVGVDQFTYTVSDGNGGFKTATVYINVKAPNSVPDAVNDSYTTPTNTKLTVVVPGVLENDSDLDTGDILRVRDNTDPSNGSVNVNGDGSFVYEPNTDFSGTDSFTYTVEDNQGASATATVYININRAPDARDDSYATTENTDLLVPPSGVLKNDIDLDGDSLTIIKFDPPTNGDIVLNADGSFTYRPDRDFVGVDSLTYTVTDGKGGNATPTVFINVVPKNKAPEAKDDSFITLKETRLTIGIEEILSNDFDADNNALFVESYSDPLNGHLHIDGNGDFVYKPKNNFIGVDTFTYTITDRNGGSSTATIFINVNTSPVAGDDRYNTPQGVVLMIPAPGVLSNDDDMDGDDISIIGNTRPSNGVLVSFNDNGSFTYSPNTGFAGVDSFTYTVSDGNGNTITPTVYITVVRANSAPVAVADNYVTPINKPIQATAPGLLGNDSDPDGDDLMISSYSDTRNGDLVVNDDGSFVYVPNTGFLGTDTFTYTVKDGFGGEATAYVTIRINRDPNGSDDTYSTPVNTNLVVSEPGLLDNDSDPDGDKLTIISNTQPSNGVLVLQPQGNFVYSPENNFVGTDSFTYTASDGNGGVVTQVVYINVMNTNVGPDANDDSFVTPFETDLVIRAPGILQNDVDLNGDNLRVVSNGNTFNGQLDVMADGSFVYKPNDNFSGTDSFTYTVSDGEGGEGKANVFIKVNRNPEGGDDFYNIGEGDKLGIPPPGLLINDVDPDGDDLNVCGNTKTSNGLLLVGADGSFSYTANAGFSGQDSFTYTVCDGFGGISTSTVYINVDDDNDGGPNTEPSATNDAYTTPKDTTLIIALPGVLANDKDEDNDVLIVVSSTEPSRGTVSMSSNGGFIYVPPSGYVGTDTFTYTVSDGNTGTDQATVTITIEDVNRPPEPKDDVIVAFMGRDKTIPISDILSNDIDQDGDQLTIVDTTQPLNGVLIQSEGFYVYTPDPGYSGADFFTYAVDDGNGNIVTATVYVNVFVPPQANDDRYSVFKNARLTTPVPGILSNDNFSADTGVRVTANTDPEFGSLSQREDGSFVYTPNNGFIGMDSYEYTIVDENGGTSDATVYITVKSFSVPPMIIPGGGDVIIIGGGGIVNGTSSDCKFNFSNCTGVDTVSGGRDELTASTSNILFTTP